MQHATRPQYNPDTARGLDRRAFLRGTAFAGAALAGARLAANGGTAHADPESPGNPVFLHSVASGDPLPDAVIIWTRVTPVPEATPGSGLGDTTVVRWDVALDPVFTRIVRSGREHTGTAFDHTVKVDVTGLEPATTYFYRFTVLDGPAAGAVSRTGRTRTAPGAYTRPRNVRFGVTSCANYEAGHFLGYRDMAARDDIEFVLHLGDYTYEYESGGYTGTYGSVIRPVQPPHRTVSLTDYRIRQGCYHRDPHLADLHAAKPMVCIWDDHEFADNTWSDGATGDNAWSGAEFAALKSAATRAYFEWMPVRTQGSADHRHLYRTLRWGSLMELIIPDLRSYRDVQVEQSLSGITDPDFLRAVGRDGRSMLGQTQFDWLTTAVTTSTAQWQMIGNEVMFAPMTIPDTLDPTIHDWLVNQLGIPPNGLAVNTDQWDGYMAERQKLIDAITAAGRTDVVFLTGDIHTSWAADIPRDAFTYRRMRGGDSVAAEFIAPSITGASVFDTVTKNRELEAVTGPAMEPAQRALRDLCPWFKWIDLRYHGYLCVDVTPERTQADWHHTTTVLDPQAVSYWAQSYATAAGRPGVYPVGAPVDAASSAFG
ncbi:alkaline phosphatase D family protein [Corynebacterium sp. P7003]|uniref:Alkaline phosphatase D family protein n=1 Tax=Corynebacterium pygosceleis TaxID=2800406 RepID=A0ABT3WT02_9CORY|nr:alkaline phosphatase D family protein [Corynebacterium pygosceleis]MCX7445367.1 alkaline phosphatase D family protein [Corynebacterium pygosceleis]